MSSLKTYAPILVLMAVFIAATALVQRHVGLEDIQRISGSFDDFYQDNRSVAVALFAIIYTLCTALSLPVAGVLTIGAGAIFGPVIGVPLVAVCATLGGVVPFMVVRKKLHGYIVRRYPKATRVLVAELDRSGSMYLLGARLAPVFPFYLVNAISGLSNLSLRAYVLATFIGILPGTTLYVLAGSEIDRAIAEGVLVSPRLIYLLFGFGLFAFFIAIYKSHTRATHLSADTSEPTDSIKGRRESL